MENIPRVLVSAPGGDIESRSNWITALAFGGCKDKGVGTSFAAPVTSGVIALILQANPNLGWRDVQAILATTSQMMDEEDESWVVNGAGLHHSYKYGFGK
jgi:subtilisin family serine protease